MSLYAPPLRTPLTDLTGALMCHQWYGRCAEVEMKVVDCLEAYGLEKGKTKCADLIDDFQECAHRYKQNQRNEAMLAERERQIKAGERGKDDRYGPSPKPYAY